jgi:serine/threonine-protein kinase
MAGETPSPEMVAASGTSEGLEPPIAWGLLVLMMAGTVAGVALGSKALLWRRAALEKSPDVLAEKAREIRARLGYAGPPAHPASGFEADFDQLRYLQTHDHPRSHWDRYPGFVRFWHRESPEPLESWRFPFRYGNLSRVSPSDPPLDVAGMSLVRLDPSGRLLQLVVVPPPVEETAAGAAPDWRALLAAGGFDPSAWNPVAPRQTPPVYADARAAWEGYWPGRADLPVHLEAAALRGKAVYFEVVWPWTQPARTVSNVLTVAERSALVTIFFMIAAIIVAAAVFAQRNLRAGRGDRHGAFRLSAFVFTAMFVSWFFGESHVATLWEVALVTMALSWTLFVAGFCWLAYLAAEPFVRRRWPEVLVTWTRLLAGEFRDALVGRDVLVGCVAGSVLAMIGFASILLTQWLGLPDTIPADVLGVAYGLKTATPLLVWRFAQSVIVGLACLFLLLLLRLVLRSQRMAVTALVLLVSVVGTFAAQHFWVNLFAGAAMAGAFVLVLLRVGLLAAVTAFYVWGLFVLFPLTWNLDAWYAGSGVVALLVLAALALFGFTTALGGRPALGKAALEE